MSTNGPPYTIHRRIEFGHCDPAGIVFFVEFYRMCNTLFEEWLTDHLDIPFAEEFFANDRMYPVVHTDADFKKALRMGDELDIALLLTGLGRSSIRYTCLGTSGTDEVFRINFVNSIGRRSAGHSIEIPADMRARMEDYLDICQAAAG